MFWHWVIVIVGIVGCVIGVYSLTATAKSGNEKWENVRKEVDYRMPFLCNKINCTKTCEGWNVCDEKW